MNTCNPSAKQNNMSKGRVNQAKSNNMSWFQYENTGTPETQTTCLSAEIKFSGWLIEEKPSQVPCGLLPFLILTDSELGVLPTITSLS